MHRRQPCHSSRHGKNSPSALFINYVEQHGGHFTVSIQTHQLYFLSLEEIPQHGRQRARPFSGSGSCHPATIQGRSKFGRGALVPSVSVGSGRWGHKNSQERQTIIMLLPSSRAGMVGAWRFHLQSFLIILLQTLLSHDACKNLTAVRLLMYYEFCLSC